MNKPSKIQYFETEGRQNLHDTVKSVKAYLRTLTTQPLGRPSKLIFFTIQGEGPLLAYKELRDLDIHLIAVTFPLALKRKMEHKYGSIEIPEKVQKFFKGVGIEVLTGRLPFDNIAGAESHNKEMELIRKCLAVFGGGMPLAIQSVLHACDVGLITSGEQVIAVTGDCAIVVTASTSEDFLHPTKGISINEIICKPRNLTIQRFTQHANIKEELSTEIAGR